MSRLQKKCFIGATGLHLLLLGLLVVAPAFLLPGKSDPTPVLEFIADNTTDAKVSGGGTPLPPTPTPTPPAAQLPPQQPVQPQVQPQVAQPRPPLQRDPDPPKVEKEKPTKPDPESLEPKPEKKPHVVQINPTVINPRERKPPTKPLPDPAVTAAAAAAATARADAARKQQFTAALNKIKGGLSSSLQVEMPTGPNGPGGGGPSYANYAQVVRKIYNDAWNAWPVPNDLTDDEATVQVSVTIARNGRVVSSRILRSSGSRAVINAAQAVLDRVTIVKEFPAESKDNERTFTFTFKLNAKKSLG